MQTITDVINWLDSLKNAIGKGEFKALWHYAEPLDKIIKMLKCETLPQRCFDSLVVEGYTQFADGFVRIASHTDDYTYYKEFIIDGEYDDPVSLTDCLKIMLKETGKSLSEIGVVYVEFANALNGEIYQYGNYLDKKWYKYGFTLGYY